MKPDKCKEQIAALRDNYERAVKIDWDGFVYSLEQLVLLAKREALDKNSNE